MQNIENLLTLYTVQCLLTTAYNINVPTLTKLFCNEFDKN